MMKELTEDITSKKVIDCFDGEFAFLSNFFEVPVEIDGIVFPTNEHFFQAMKTLDINKRKEIAAAATPGKAKRLGRTIQLRPDWEEVKIDIMREGLKAKFAIPELAQKLLDTGDALLVEGNTWHDQTWGDCRCDKCIGTPGRNLLGQLLMEIREEKGMR